MPMRRALTSRSSATSTQAAKTAPKPHSALAALGVFALLGGCAGQSSPAALAPVPHAPKRPAESADGGQRKPAANTLNAYTLDAAGPRPALQEALLEKGERGFLIDGVRVIVGPFGARKIPQTTRINLNAFIRIPMHLGGGFLFRTSSALFQSSSFDGPLNPVVSIPGAISNISFGPKSIVLRASEGDRISLGVPDFREVPPSPPGLVDVQSLGDGRALAIAEFGRILSTIDRGATWSDRTAKLSAPPTELLQIEGEIWVRDENGRVYKLDQSGDLRSYDRLPEQSLKNKLPSAWRGQESPLRTALKKGVPLDSATALVAEAGDIWRVDLRSGALLSKIDFTLPPAAQCEGLKSFDDIVFICSGSGTSLVVSGSISGDNFKAERTFGVEGPFYASDDGGLVLGAPCTPAKSSPFGACVRKANGEWEDLSIDPAPVRDGESGLPADSAIRISRWIPRADTMPLAISVSGANIAAHDPLTNKSTLWKGLGYGDIILIVEQGPKQALRGRSMLIDSGWTVAQDGSVWGWSGTTRSVHVKPDGVIQLSPYPFDSGFPVGALGLFRTRDGRLYQSSDHGRSFVEVQAPPTLSFIPSNQQMCSAVGCDLGHWIRVGWPAQPPVNEPEGAALPPAPELSAPLLPELVCNSKGEQKTRQLAISPASPEDFGMGALRIPLSGELPNGDSFIYGANPISRQLWHPMRGDTGGMDGHLRALVHGFGIEFTDNSDFNAMTPAFVVLGPNRNSSAFQRTVSFTEPFDPAFSVRSVNYGLSAMVSAVRASGNPIGNILNTDGLNLQAFVPVLSADPAGATEYLFNAAAEAGEIFGTLGGGASPKIRFWATRTGNSSPVSAIALSANEIAMLAMDTDGKERVYSIKPGSISLLFELPESTNPQQMPANPDALAIGPQGSLAVIRTPSGTRPVSSLDPALLFKGFPQSPAGAPVELAPWSKLLPADDPACQQDTGAFRSIIHTSAPWVKVRGGKSADLISPMMSAKIAWGRERACIEALELPERTEDLSSGIRAETIVVAQFTGKRLAARGFVTRGAEMNHPLSCSIAMPPP